MTRKRVYRKLCEACLKTFVNGAAKNCPFCGSTRWRYQREDQTTFAGVDVATVGSRDKTVVTVGTLVGDRVLVETFLEEANYALR